MKSYLKLVPLDLKLELDAMKDDPPARMLAEKDLNSRPQRTCQEGGGMGFVSIAQPALGRSNSKGHIKQAKCSAGRCTKCQKAHKAVPIKQFLSKDKNAPD